MQHHTNRGHPDGPERFMVREQTRGRWRCFDIVEHSNDQQVSVPLPCPGTRVDDGRHSPSICCDHESAVDLAGKKNAQRSPVETQKDGEEAGRAEQDTRCLSNPSPALNSNFNASPRRLRSRITKADHASDTLGDKDPESTVTRVSDVWGVVVVVVIVAMMFSYLFSCLTPSVVPDVWQWIHSVWKLVVQAVAVLVVCAVLVIALQVLFPSYRLRQWIARIFQLEMKEVQTDPKSRIQTADNTTPVPVLTTTGDGDKELVANSDPTRPQHENEIVEKQTENLPQSRTLEKRANPSGCTIKAETELANQKAGDVSEGRGHMIQADAKLERGKGYQKMMKSMYRKFLQIRRKFKAEMSTLRRTDKYASEVLSRVQLALPVLEREKQALLAELEAIHKQHQEERRRNHDLMVRLRRLNQQFVRIGLPQGTAATQRTQSQDCPHPAATDPHRPLPGLQLAQQQPHQYQHPNHHHHVNHHHLQQQQYSRPCSTTTTAHHLKDDTKADSAHNIRPSLRSSSLPH